MFMKINEDQISNYLASPGKEGVKGDFLSGVMPIKDFDLKNYCNEDERKSSQYEIVLVTEVNTLKSEFEILPGQNVQFATSGLQVLTSGIPTNEKTRQLNDSSVYERAKDIWNSGWFKAPTKDFDPHSPIGRELFVEALVHASASSNLSENELAKKMSSVIESLYKTEEEKLHTLSAISLRLYRNYNSPRNPFKNNTEFNPDGLKLPSGDMSISDLMKSAASFDSFSGGVCNDISEAVAQIGEHLFPNKDVLTVNSGTHFGVLVSDGKTNHVIDGGTEISMKNHLTLDPNLSSTNLRISKVVDGKQKQIAVVDTEMGQVVESAFKTGKTLLKTDADISSMMAELKKGKFGITAGAGKLSDSNVLIVVAKFDDQKGALKTYAGAGASARISNADLETKYQIHIKAGLEGRIISYVNPDASVKVSAGVRGSGMYTINQPPTEPGTIGRADISGAVDLYQRVDFEAGQDSKNGIKVMTRVEVEQTLGSKNWGETTGALSTPGKAKAGPLLENMTFHLNQINADVKVEKPLHQNVSVFVSADYQGSNIGGTRSLMTGLDISSSNGASIIVFSGYRNSKLSGFKTQHGLLAGNTGIEAGAKYRAKNGVEIRGGAQGIGKKASVRATLTVPLKR